MPEFNRMMPTNPMGLLGLGFNPITGGAAQIAGNMTGPMMGSAGLWGNLQGTLDQIQQGGAAQRAIGLEQMKQSILTAGANALKNSGKDIEGKTAH